MTNERWTISFLPVAQEDFDGAAEYIKNTLGNPKAAKALLNEVYEALKQLERFPMLGSMVEDELLASCGYRRLGVKNFLVFYKLQPDDKRIVVMRVLYGRREYQGLL